MTRSLPTGLQNAVDQSVVAPFFAISIALPDPVTVWTGTGILTFDGREWIGAGGVGTLDIMGEQTDGSATGVSVSLLNVPEEFRSDIIDQATRGAPMELWYGALSPDYSAIVGVRKVWTGRLDTYDVDDAGASITVTITGESRARDQQRPAIKRFTSEYQQKTYPADQFFDYLPQLAEVQILWAKGDQGAVTQGGAGGTSQARSRANAL
ncbi:hypothetical protein [Sphingomonas sp.]|uniref:hypothetical protein n=1 Tax=Sphingomonas sp. TaxID=28214 RepID=UPI003B3A2BC6